MIVKYRDYSCAVALVAMLSGKGLNVTLQKWGRGWLVVAS